MRVTTLPAGEVFRVEVAELSALATRGQSASDDGELLAIGDELTEVFAIALSPGGPDRRPLIWKTGYAAPPDSGSNFEGVAADRHGRVVVVTEFPAGLVMVEMAALSRNRFMTYTRLRFDEDSMRELADMKTNEFLQPEGAILLRDGHVLVAHEKKPRGFFELGSPGTEAFGVHPGSYLPTGAAFTAPAQLCALAWWPVTDHLDDISDLAEWNDRLYLLSDQSSCIARLASDHLRPGDDVDFDAIWKLSGEVEKAEGLAFMEDGQLYVGLDVNLKENPNKENLLRFRGLPD